MPKFLKKGRKFQIIDMTRVCHGTDRYLRTMIPVKIMAALKLQAGDSFIWRVINPEKGTLRVFRQDLAQKKD